jgi:hypothetical protein
MKYCTCKDIDDLVKSLIRQGWRFHRGGKHGRLLAPDGKRTLTVPCSPSDRCAFLNFRRDVRKAQEFALVRVENLTPRLPLPRPEAQSRENRQ